LLKNTANWVPGNPSERADAFPEKKMAPSGQQLKPALYELFSFAVMSFFASAAQIQGSVSSLDRSGLRWNLSSGPIPNAPGAVFGRAA